MFVFIHDQVIPTEIKSKLTKIDRDLDWTQGKRESDKKNDLTIN